MSKGNVEVKIACDTVAGVGEGAIWDYKYERLLWIDTQGSVFIYTPSDGKNREIKVGKLVGTVVPYKENAVIVALIDGIYELNLESEELSFICRPENPPVAGNKYNDGKCDAQGRLWVGTMNMKEDTPTAGLYIVKGNGECQQVLKNVITSNGICWSLDNKKMYYHDSPLRTISRKRFTTIE